MSTARHPETDGQSEIANKGLVIYLRAFVNHHQDDWVDWLPSAEFSDNVNENASIQVAPFELNYGFKPRLSFDWAEPKETLKNPLNKDQRIAARQLAEKMDTIWKEAVEILKHSQKQQASAANKYRQDVLYKAGDMVYLSADGIPDTDRPSEKLSDQWYGPFEVEQLVGNSYHLKLPPSMKIHPVFHISKLMRSDENPLPNQYQEPQGPVEISENGEPE